MATLVHTLAMFSFATVDTALNLDLQSKCYIDNRDFTVVNNLLPQIAPRPFFISTMCLLRLDHHCSQHHVLFEHLPS